MPAAHARTNKSGFALRNVVIIEIDAPPDGERAHYVVGPGASDAAVATLWNSGGSLLFVRSTYGSICGCQAPATLAKCFRCFYGGFKRSFDGLSSYPSRCPGRDSSRSFSEQKEQQNGHRDSNDVSFIGTYMPSNFPQQGVFDCR